MEAEIQRLREELLDCQLSLSETNRQLERMYKHIPVMLHSIDEQGRLTEVNDEWLARLGYDRGEVIGKEATQFLTAESRSYAKRSCLPRFFETGQIRNEVLQFRSKGGRVIDVLLSAVRDEGAQDRKRRSLSVSVDISERERLQQTLDRLRRRLETYQARLRSLTEELALVEHNERRRIAATLHDEALQSLAFAKIRFDEAKREAPRDAQQHLGELGAALDRAIDDIRRAVNSMSPLILDEVGLPAAIDALASRFFDEHGLRVIVEDEASSEISSEATAVLVYWSLSELITNVAKHAHAEQVLVIIRAHENSITAYVEDDGDGFDAASWVAGQNTAGFGLRNLRERIERVGGSFDINSQTGAGTRVAFSVSVDGSQA